MRKQNQEWNILSLLSGIEVVLQILINFIQIFLIHEKEFILYINFCYWSYWLYIRYSSYLNISHNSLRMNYIIYDLMNIFCVTILSVNGCTYHKTTYLISFLFKLCVIGRAVTLHFFVRNNQVFLTLDTIDALSLAFGQMQIWYNLKSIIDHFTDLRYYFICV